MTMRMQRVITRLLAWLFVFQINPWPTPFATGAESQSAASPAPKYVFVFMADGAGIAHMEITRQYNRIVHNAGLVISDRIMTEGTLGLMTTHPADSLTTDSAAAATAMAVGCKAKLGALGICADGTVTKSAVEIAKEKGMRIGLVTNAPVYDASPAAFSMHVPDRRQSRTIIDRYLEIAPDVLLGGGREQFLPKSHPGGRRPDDKDLIGAFTNRGYRYVANKQELEQVQRGKVLGLFSLRDMSFEIDRDKKTEPSISDMTQVAIRLLHEDNPRGFFAFIENENIDTASHLNDIAAVVQDYREFDRAVGLAYDFYRKYPRDTLIIVTSDHETGGLGFTLGLRELSAERGSNQVFATVADLKKIQSIPISLRKAAEILGPNPTTAALDQFMTDYFRGFTLPPDLKEALIKRQPLSRTIYLDSTANTLGMMVASNTQAYWQTTSHTNHPVFVAAIGVGAERFKGYQDNVDFGKSLKSIVERVTVPFCLNREGKILTVQLDQAPDC